ncbi:bifunctional phosphoribosyl-AMP cyclohydrolase/phosphoribosyl-ATP diphosphatase HisIE [Sphingomicrobium flavum]|uniref:bifunctional phosphoribosyl-AMP cyclohydrolase/phosphoribosyl-ATP diphosphatase HisIE n=1 Tax=Sphingomicrobium flavum TaxID=1229164 RepID=UPI0021ADA669|nr:bifunctional phosphoribosyl-AMP cyclohydrolase/phosphoribosyl-ATP diphosphatase HisIE [Sphingomicrobium flavum]
MKIDWDKMDGLVPAIVQHAATGEVRMLGYMNREALEATRSSGRVTFWSRSKQALWEKGATNGDWLELVDIQLDCDGDALLVRALPKGPTCHLGSASCFGDDVVPPAGFIAELSLIIDARAEAADEQSYTARLLARGVKRIAQKVGEEGVEVALAATAGDKDELANESADLLYHLLVLLKASDLTLEDVTKVLRERHKA